MNAPNQTLICNPQIEWSELLSVSVSFQPFRVSSCLNVCVWSWKNARSRKEKKRKEKKEREKTLKVNCQDSSSHFSASCQLFVTITRPAVWKRNTSQAVSKAIKGEKSEVNPSIIFCKKKIKAELIVTFNDRLSWYRIGAAMQPD